MASPSDGVDAVVADCEGLDLTDDQALLARELFCPGIRNIGGIEGIAMLAAPHPLLLYNATYLFPTDNLRRTYGMLKKSKQLRIEPTRLDEVAVTGWLSGYK